VLRDWTESLLRAKIWNFELREVQEVWTLLFTAVTIITHVMDTIFTWFSLSKGLGTDENGSSYGEVRASSKSSSHKQPEGVLGLSSVVATEERTQSTKHLAGHLRHEDVDTKQKAACRPSVEFPHNPRSENRPVLYDNSPPITFVMSHNRSRPTSRRQSNVTGTHQRGWQPALSRAIG
jgi:hypothetical protein